MQMDRSRNSIVDLSVDHPLRTGNRIEWAFVRIAHAVLRSELSWKAKLVYVVGKLYTTNEDPGFTLALNDLGRLCGFSGKHPGQSVR